VEPILALFALLLQAAFSGSETGLVRANWIRISTWVSENRLWAGRARELLEHKETALITTLVGTNAFMVVISNLSEHYFVHAVGRGGTFISVPVVSLVVLLFAQYLPKTFAQTWPERWLSLFAPLLQLGRIVFWPLTWLLGRLSGAPIGRKSAFKLTRKDVLFALRENARLSVTRPLDHSTARPLSSIAARLLNFPETTVGDVMTPNNRVVAVPESITQAELESVIREHSFTRLPVYRGQPEDVIGVIHVRDLLLLSRREIRKPFFVSEQARAIEVMHHMKDQAEHLAVVQDQNHRTVGIVTLEDLLEELVGEIRSE
jgi:putative hemolysin